MRKGEVKLVGGRYQQEFTERQTEGNDCLSPNLCFCSQWATLFKDIILKPSTKRKTELGSDRVTKRKGTRAEEKEIEIFLSFPVFALRQTITLYVALFFFSHTLLFCVCATQESILFRVKICCCFLPTSSSAPPFFTVSITLFGPSLLRSVCQWCHFVYAVWTLITYQAFSRLLNITSKSISPLFSQSLLAHTSRL